MIGIEILFYLYIIYIIVWEFDCNYIVKILRVLVCMY